MLDMSFESLSSHESMSGKLTSLHYWLTEMETEATVLVAPQYTIVITNIMLLENFVASKFHFLSLLDGRYNAWEVNDGHNSWRGTDIFNL